MNESSDKINEKGIAHLVCRISDVHDIVHRFSPRGYELLTDEFLAFPDSVRPLINPRNPVLLEVTGKNLSEDEQQSVERAIRTHYCLQLEDVMREIRHCIIKTIWFAVSFILSSIFIFIVPEEASDLLRQLAYLPFWFFGYRLLTYPILDLVPLVKDMHIVESLAAMQLHFTEKPVGILTDELRDQSIKNNADRKHQAREYLRKNDLAREYFVEDHTVCLECCADDALDLTNHFSVAGKEMVSDELASYLQQADPFIRLDVPVKLTFLGNHFTEDEQAMITRGLKNHFVLRTAHALQAMKDNLYTILNFTAGFIIAGIVLTFAGQTVDTARHEFMLIVLWFFGDYLVEYVLLTQYELIQAWKKRRFIEKMDIFFK